MTGFIVQTGFDAYQERGHVNISPIPQPRAMQKLFSLLCGEAISCISVTRNEGTEYVFGPATRESVATASMRVQHLMGELGHTAVSTDEIRDVELGKLLFDYQNVQ